MDNIAGTKSSLTWAVHLSVAALVFLWLFPTLGLFVSSFRTSDQIATGGWWKSLVASEQNLTLRAAGPDSQVQTGDVYVIEGRLFEEGSKAEISRWGTSSREISTYAAGETGAFRSGEQVTVAADGTYRIESPQEMSGSRGKRIFVTATTPPEFTTDNYKSVLFDETNREGMTKAFFNTLTVTIPATILPILIAAFAAYALAWMDFPGRALLIAMVVVYNLQHSANAWSVAVMASCRALIIFTCATYAQNYFLVVSSWVAAIVIWGPAVTVFLYTLAISIVARREVDPERGGFGGPKTVMNMIAAMPLLDAAWLVAMGLWPASLVCVACAGLTKLGHRRIAGS